MVSKRTSVITANRRLHERLHPLPHRKLLIRAEVVRLLEIVDQPKPILAWVDVLIDDDLVPDDVDVALDFRLLQHRLEGKVND